MLVLWAFGLQTPMLWLLRISEEITLQFAGTDSRNSIMEEPSGDWTCRILVDDRGIEEIGAQNISSIDFSIQKADVILFTFSLPFFWSIVLGKGFDRFTLPALVWGTLSIAIAEVLLLFIFLKITAYGALAQLHPSPAGLAKWLRDLSTYLIVSVIPFALPIIAAVGFHAGLKQQFFHPPRDSGFLKKSVPRAG